MQTLVFVHGWSVTDTATYGTLPQRVQAAATAAGIELRLADIWLSEYVSFDDAVTVDDLVLGLDHALRGLDLGEAPFACITHSFGGPLVRAWLAARRERPDAFVAATLSHLVMLAPANFGSALARLGKGVLGRMRAWWNGVEPGQRLLDWLTQGSEGSLRLNLDFIHGPDPAASGQFQFVLTGDRPDRAFYDHLNPYTAENGSDGVVRIAAANLNARHAVLSGLEGGAPSLDRLVPHVVRGPRVAFKMVAGAAHGGADQGIMASTRVDTVAAVIRCLAVRDRAGYARLCDAFEQENAVRDAHKVELEAVGPFPPRAHIHDPCSLLIVRLTDSQGQPLPDTRYLLTAGTPPNPDWLPQGFMLDRQANPRHPGTYTFYMDHALLAGDGPVLDPRDPSRVLRPARVAHRPYGCRLLPPTLTGLVHHAIAQTSPEEDLLEIIGPHQTTVLDVVLPRKVHEGVFRLVHDLRPDDFRHPDPGPLIS